jgi:hypothetical protein
MAIFEYETYLRKLPDAPNRHVVHELLGDARHASRMQQRWCPTGVVGAPLSDERPRPTRSLHKRWWFWTAVGAVAASSLFIIERRL